MLEGYLHRHCILPDIGKILHALQISKPVLLEGSPGMSMASLVQALACRIGVAIIRINLSDQTLASQSALEGLNAVFYHRARGGFGGFNNDHC